MKRSLLTILVLTALVACQQTKPSSDGAEIATTNSEAGASNLYGAKFVEENVLDAAQLQHRVQDKDSLQAVVTAEIVESCQAKGCWMDIKLSDNSTMKVTFRDYGFFLPVEDLKGKTVVFSGTAKPIIVSVEDQRHYAQDAGKSKEEIAAITTPRQELRFVADGVIIK